MTRILIALILLSAPPLSPAQECGDYSVEELLPRGGGRVDWSRGPADVIAFDHDEDQDNYFEVSTLSLKDRTATCLTCERDIPGMGRNRGQPAWHPSGEYIVFQAQSGESTAGWYKTNPGRGVDNVLWLTDKGGNWFVQLTQLTPDALGVLHPHFSTDGSELTWTEMYAPSMPLVPGQAAGLWRLKKAKINLAANPPSLEEIETYQPGDNLSLQPGFYENHGLSPDGSLIIFSSNAMRSGMVDRLNNDIFTFEPRNGAVQRLTDTRYNEHASFFPDGRRVLWMTSRNQPGRGTELWVMDAHRPRAEDHRLTYFNRAGCPGAENGDLMIAADSSLNAAGDALVVFVQRELFAGEGRVLLVRFRYPSF